MGAGDLLSFHETITTKATGAEDVISHSEHRETGIKRESKRGGRGQRAQEEDFNAQPLVPTSKKPFVIPNITKGIKTVSHFTFSIISAIALFRRFRLSLQNTIRRPTNLYLIQDYKQMPVSD